MNLRMLFKFVGCCGASNRLSVAAGAHVVPHCYASPGSSAIRATSIGALHAPTVPALGMKDMTAGKSDYTITITVWFLAECAFFISTFVDNWEIILLSDLTSTAGGAACCR